MGKHAKWSKEKIIADIKNNSSNGIAPTVTNPNIRNLSYVVRDGYFDHVKIK